MDKVFIFGHKNPDTDSVTSAIAMEYLKRSRGEYAEARVLGMLTDETKYILDRFNIKYPKFLKDVKLQIKDILYHRDLMLKNTNSIEDLFNYLEEHNITGVPIVDSNKKFISIVTSKMTLKAVIEEDTGNIFTSFENIINSLNGKKIIQFDSEIRGIVSTDDNHKYDDKTILIADNLNLIKDINQKIELLVVTFDLTKDLIDHLKNLNVNVIKSEFSPYEIRKKLKYSNYLLTIITNERSHVVYENDYYDDFQKYSIKFGHNNYPVVDANNVCLGLLRLTDVKNINRKKVILVDHNESNQSIDGLDEAEILEIVDHHKIGDLSTKNPINFRSMTVGSTNTIIYILFKESRIEIPKDIASIMLGGIIADTLSLTSPTTTDMDKKVVKELEIITGLNHREYAKDIFNASVNLYKMNEEELIKQDMKSFSVDNKTYRIAQITLLDATEFMQKKEKLISVLNKIKEDTESEFVLLFVIDILKEGSYLLFNEDNRIINHLNRAFNKNIFEGVFLKDILSRKLQIIPLLIDSY